jgi:hypothetical protein
MCNFCTDLISDEEDNEQEGKEEDKEEGGGDPGQVTFQDMYDGSMVLARRPEELPASIPWISMGPSKNFTGQVTIITTTPLFTPSPDKPSVPAMTLTPAQPRYAWGWLAAGAFAVENPSTVPWLAASRGWCFVMFI